ncbi:MAG: ABC transporter ATP-binding protein [Cyanophyceae cyanobacterium]
MTKEAIATTGLTKQFDRHVAVRDVELQIASGEVYGLIGPNGAGKTTLLRLLAALEEPTAGEIWLYGQRLRWERGEPSLKQYIGYLADDFPLYDDLTVWDYLDYFARLYRLPKGERRRRLQEVLDLVQLIPKQQALVATLSRGMKQRLSLARTILHEPLVLLLDEPVSGLDPVARERFRETVKLLQAAGMTIVISSHILSDLAELCSSIGMMEMGCLVESTSLATLYNNQQQTITVSTLGDVQELQQALSSHPLVTGWEALPEPGSLHVNCSGSTQECAELLRSLVAAGIPLTQFHREPENLEAIFFRSGERQAS